jgi:hypothetical protein
MIFITDINLFFPTNLHVEWISCYCGMVSSGDEQARWPPDVDCSSEYVESAVVERQQGVVI